MWSSITGAHASLSVRRGAAGHYLRDVSPFASVADFDDAAAWAELAALLGPGPQVLVTGASVVPHDWKLHADIAGVQLVDAGVVLDVDERAVRLTRADVPEVLDLVARTRPGPFLTRTIELGSYIGIRVDGELVAVAGERFRPSGFTEISAVCTDPRFQGRGLAGALVRTVVTGIRERGEVPFLHTGATNTGAIRLYEALGFALRKPVSFLLASPAAG